MNYISQISVPVCFKFRWAIRKLLWEMQRQEGKQQPYSRSSTLLLTCWLISSVWGCGQPYNCLIIPGSSFSFSDSCTRWAERSNCSVHSDKTFACQRVGNKSHEKSGACDPSEMSRCPVCGMLRYPFWPLYWVTPKAMGVSRGPEQEQAL